MVYVIIWGARIAGWWCMGLMIGTLRAQILAEVAGEFSSPQLTFCADS